MIPAPARIDRLDIIRGIAVMGILSVNIAALGMMWHAYYNPVLLGFEGWADKATWAVNYWLVEGRFRALFAILFGASLMIISDRARARGQQPWRTHLPRLAILFAIGLLHFTFFWWGDVLTLLAFTGLFAFGFARHGQRVLLSWAIIFLVLSILLDVAGAVILVKLAQVGTELPALQSAPIEAAKAAAFSAHFADHGTYANWASDLLVHVLPFQLVGILPEFMGFMLLGMVLLRSGFLSGEAQRASYRRWAIWGAGLTLGIAALATIAVVLRGFDPLLLAVLRNTLFSLLRPATVIGLIALIILTIDPASRAGIRLAATGRMAMTNYLLPTLLTAPFLYGYGLGLHNQLSRAELWLFFVPALWAIMLLFSPAWLTRYRYGPLEWIWRSLSRGQPQPVRRALVAA